MEPETARIHALGKARTLVATHHENNGMPELRRALKNLELTDLETGIGPSLKYPAEAAKRIRRAITYFYRAKLTRQMDRRFVTEVRQEEGVSVMRIWRVR